MPRYWREADDPLRVLERRESKTCAGCQHLQRDMLIGQVKFSCGKHIRPAATEICDMRKCPKYVEKS